MQQSFRTLSLNHSKAPVEIREKFHLSEQDLQEFPAEIRRIWGLEELMLLSTCNRTEIYYQSETDLSDELIKLLCLRKGVEDPAAQHDYFEVPGSSLDSVRHLFRVAMGLDSQVLGDLQISNQVKQAYARSSEQKLAGPFLHRLLHTIFHTNKRVQQETAWRDGAASVSYAASELGAELTAMIEHPQVLVIGLGEMGADAARNLKGGPWGRFALCNRSLEKAESLAAELDAEVLPFEQVKTELCRFDLIVSAVSAPEPIISADAFEGAEFHPRYLIDLSVPRSIDPAVEQTPGIVVYDIDEIRNRTEETLRQRREAVSAVEAIVDQELSGFRLWSKELTISPAIHKFKEALEQIRQEELARYLKHAGEAEAQLVEKVTKSMVKKIVKLPVLQLKAACQRGEQDALVEVLSDLFDLEKTRESSAS